MKGYIEDYISRERENPTSKKVLTAQTGLNERAARSHIAEARRRGGAYYRALIRRLLCHGKPGGVEGFC